MPPMKEPAPHLRYWPAWMVEGLALVLLGAAAIWLPLSGPPAITASASSVGWVLSISAVIRFFLESLIGTGRAGFWGIILSSVLAATVGFALLGSLIPTSMSPVSLLTAFCALQAAISVVSAAEYKHAHSPGWDLLLWSAVVPLVLAVVLWLGYWPVTTPTFGFPVGIVLISEGACTAVMANRARCRITK